MQAVIEPPTIELTTKQPKRRKKGEYSNYQPRTIVVLRGKNRHQRRRDAKVARTKDHHSAMSELRAQMRHNHRHRLRASFRINPGGQFRVA
ncbi:MAG: hypothetical protein AAFQ07_07500 [Chloroflexota bacterium]